MHKKTLHKYLEKVAQEISTDPVYSPLNTLFLLPTRRSVRYFSKSLQEASGSDSVLMPEVKTFSEWVFSLSPLVVGNNDVLLLELFSTYKRYWPDLIELDEFYRWGQMMLNDFDEIDKYCVNAKIFFNVISDEKKIEAEFSIDDDLKKWLTEFWGQINEKKALERDFLMTWKILGDVYADFKATLKEKGLAYEGMVCLDVLNRIQEDKLPLPFQKIHFVGFNAFTTFEERLIQALSLHYNVHLHWDADAYYLDNDFHEAGKFLRKYKEMFPAAQHHWNVGNDLRSGRKFYFHAAPLTQGQAHLIANLLDRPFEGSTAVVLCDDNLREPVIHAISPDLNINLTMGKSIGDSPLSELMYILFRLSVSAKVSRKEAERLSHHPFLHFLLGQEGAEHWIKWLKEYPAFFIPLPDIAARLGELEQFITVAVSFSDITGLWLKALDIIRRRLNGDDRNLLAITTTFIHVIREQEKRLLPYMDDISILSAYQLFRTALRSISIPYKTSEDAPIQVMGFLETRLIDFDRVIIAGANEDILPAGKWGSSYIPFHLRKIFGLPTLQEYDGVYAYHFFRLLQRSAEAHFIYNDVQGDTPFQKSRFLEQILLELNTPENHLQEFRWNYDTSKTVSPTSTLVIPKTKEHIKALHHRSFSQTALSLYLTCPVQFYLQYVEEIKEPDSFEENLDAGQFGNVLHKAIEWLYQDLKDRELTRELLLSRKKFIDKCLKDAFELEGFKYESLSGENLLAKDVIYEAIKRLIALDIQALEEHPFRIHALEGVFERTLHSTRLGEIRFKGKIDRLDILTTDSGAAIFRVLDYKTGNVDLGNNKVINEEDIQSLFKRMQIKQKDKLFQGLFYLFLLNRPVATAGFYSLRKLSNGMMMLNNGQLITSDLIRIFEAHLIELVEEILNPDIPFTQNSHPRAYTYSPYQFVAP